MGVHNVKSSAGNERAKVPERKQVAMGLCRPDEVGDQVNVRITSHLVGRTICANRKMNIVPRAPLPLDGMKDVSFGATPTESRHDVEDPQRTSLPLCHASKPGICQQSRQISNCRSSQIF